eukprot:CAMPEP_0206176530 /NCGR_PEP_ID=MMETSP1474-20131121/58382_1 /ASSEMBLY_ACC=CAM_ASM_001110 /TAXON_ID=97495 /ORGANISM="Imantonia sp., Strain RCC918" /LENGTH=355 /DNA_ID=CAMNT_0053587643 /DNA_START=105 /DNA_END=1168 /DNA_ORIENTATION=-
MHGQCAVVVKEQKWMAEDLVGEELGNWDYKVRVEPWTLFGEVTVALKGNDMQVVDIYGGTPAKPPKNGEVVVALAAVPVGGDSMFEIHGYGVPVGDPVLSCKYLYKDDELSTCPLGVHFLIKSLLPPEDNGEVDENGFPVLSPGNLLAVASIETWVEPSDVTIHFDAPIKVQDLWNARLYKGGDGVSKSATFRLQRQPGSWFGERKSAFGFSAEGSISRLPNIDCEINQNMPAPPPPIPPFPPPGAPPFFAASRTSCFLGGDAIFVKAPDTDELVGWTHSWEVLVRMQEWQVGVHMMLDFYGDHMAEHPLKLLSIDPPDAVRRNEVTRHSIDLTLRSSPVRSFKILASGAVMGMR